jgi:hypothetical protein
VTILDLLAQLVNKSLVVVEQRPDVGTRYALLETIRPSARDATGTWRTLWPCPSGPSAS